MQSLNPVESLLGLYRILVSRNLALRQGSSPTGARPRFSLTGPLSAGKATAYSINGVDFEVTPDTAILGELRFGTLACVTGSYRHHTVRVAGRIIVDAQRRESQRS